MTNKTWQIDPAHTNIGFTVRHMVVAKVNGRFTKFEGTLTQSGDDFAGSAAAITIDASSIDTQVGARDDHLRSADFFDAAAFPTITFRSKRMEKAGKDRYRLIGDLTIRGTTKEVELDSEFLGGVTDPFGVERLAFSAATRIDRKEFGLTWNQALEAGGVLVSDRVDVQIEVQWVKAEAKENAA